MQSKACRKGMQCRTYAVEMTVTQEGDTEELQSPENSSVVSRDQKDTGWELPGKELGTKQKLWLCQEGLAFEY